MNGPDRSLPPRSSSRPCSCWPGASARPGRATRPSGTRFSYEVSVAVDRPVDDLVLGSRSRP